MSPLVNPRPRHKLVKKTPEELIAEVRSQQLGLLPGIKAERITRPIRLDFGVRRV